MEESAEKRNGALPQRTRTRRNRNRNRNRSNGKPQKGPQLNGFLPEHKGGNDTSGVEAIAATQRQGKAQKGKNSDSSSHHNAPQRQHHAAQSAGVEALKTAAPPAAPAAQGQASGMESPGSQSSETKATGSGSNTRGSRGRNRNRGRLPGYGKGKGKKKSVSEGKKGAKVQESKEDQAEQGRESEEHTVRRPNALTPGGADHANAVKPGPNTPTGSYARRPLTPAQIEKKRLKNQRRRQRRKEKKAESKAREQGKSKEGEGTTAYPDNARDNGAGSDSLLSTRRQRFVDHRKDEKRQEREAKVKAKRAERKARKEAEKKEREQEERTRSQQEGEVGSHGEQQSKELHRGSQEGKETHAHGPVTYAHSPVKRSSVSPRPAAVPSIAPSLAPIPSTTAAAAPPPDAMAALSPGLSPLSPTAGGDADDDEEEERGSVRSTASQRSRYSFASVRSAYTTIGMFGRAVRGGRYRALSRRLLNPAYLAFQDSLGGEGAEAPDASSYKSGAKSVVSASPVKTVRVRGGKTLARVRHHQKQTAVP